MRMHVLLRLLALAALIMPAAACPPNRPTLDVTGPIVNPFAPASLRAHPLTHLDADTRMLILHVELRDAWGEPVKGTGQLSVDLYRPASGSDAGLESRELVWEADLSNLTLNHRLYDPATRTYRLQLTNLPEWLEESAEGRVRLHVVLATTGAGGEPIRLEDAYVLRY